MGSIDHYVPSETFGEPLGDLPTFWDAFATQVATSPEALALACTHQSPGLFGIRNLSLDVDDQQIKPYLRWTYKSLHEGILRLIISWRKLGVSEGSTLVMFVQNGAEYVLAIWAAIAIGCNIMPISPRNLTNIEEAIHMIKTGLSVSSGTRPVVLVGDEQLAAAVDNLEVLQTATRIILSNGESSDQKGWIPFQSLMDSTYHIQLSSERIADILGPNPSHHGGSILFTSGTTALPKGLYHPYQQNMGRIFPRRYQRGGLGNLVPGSKLVSTLPNNHAMGWLCVTASLMTGAALIYPGPAFDPSLMRDTIFGERVTHMMMVPTMIHALVAVKAASSRFANQPLDFVENVMLGGTSLSVADVGLVMSTLGVRGFENFYGCSEGLLTSSQWAGDANEVADGNDISAGGPLRGYRLLIVDPETGEVVPRGVLGEVHCSGPSLIGGYIGGVGKDAWYTDRDGTSCYRTGDQGKIDEQGRLFITGRYKDMIIRGGENISPSAVEAVLAKNKLLSPLIPQIVGAKDAIAGEVPVAVIRGKVTPEIREAIQSEVVARMGALYVPEEVVSTEDLGLSDYPRTTSGKIQKPKLTSLVNQHRKQAESRASDRPRRMLDKEQLTDLIKKIWAKAVGLDPLRIQLDASTSEFADSITIMRVREGIKRQTGKALSLQDMATAGTIRKQVDVLLAMQSPAHGSTTTPARRTARKGPPALNDMVHLTEHPELLESTKMLVVDTIGKYGLGWDDVEDVIPAYDFNSIMTQTKLNEDWTWHFAIQAVDKVDRRKLGRVVEAVVMNNGMLASFIVSDPQSLGTAAALHVLVKQSSAFLDLVIEDGGSLSTNAALVEAANRFSRPDWVTLGGPLYRTTIYDIEETESAGLVMSMNHAIVDASMAHMIQEDLDRALAIVAKSPGATVPEILAQLQPHVDYKPWADSYFNLRTSVEARAATRWHVKRLQSLAKHVNAGALFPKKPAVSSTERQLAVGLDPVRCSFDIPDIHRLRREHPDITAAVVVKAAVALMNMQRTGCPAAVFGNLEASRKYFPFVPKAMLDHAGAHLEATDVSGPAYQMVFNIVEVGESERETVLQFLSRMQEDQTLLTRYSAVPLREVIKGLDQVSSGAGDLLPRIIDTQHFNWVPGLGTTGTDPHQHVRTLAAVNRPTIGLIFAAGLGGKEQQTVFLNVYGDGHHISQEEAAGIGEQVEAITKWLVGRDNWKKPVTYVSASLADP